MLRRFQVRLLSRLGRWLSRLLRRLLWNELPASDRRRLYRVVAPLLSDLLLAHKILAPRSMGRQGGQEPGRCMEMGLPPKPSITTKAASVAD